MQARRWVMVVGLVAFGCGDQGRGPVSVQRDSLDDRPAAAHDATAEADAARFMDAGLSLIRDVDAGPADDAEPRPPAPATQLEHVIDLSIGVFTGTVTAVSMGARIDELDVHGLHWRIYRDFAAVDADRGVGTTAVGSLSVPLFPDRCEAYDASGQHLPNTRLSSCTSRNAANSPITGERIVGFVMGGQGGGNLVLRLVIEDGLVDDRDLREPLADRSEAAVWSTIKARWAELGR